MSLNDAKAFQLPKIPVSHRDFISYISRSKDEAVHRLVAPYNDYEAKLREGFAQHRDHQALQDSHVNAVPIFKDGNDVLRVHARNIYDTALNEKYVMPLDSKDRKPEGTLATVESIQEFKKNFNLFSESSLTDLDWSNVVAAGSSVVTALLPVPDEHKTSKRALREYYHEKLAPSSDVDLFIWGLDEAAAIEKIKQIESSVRNAILEEVTTVRTKNAVTIACHYPIRHVQIVLRLYKSVSEILSGFDVDCSCFAYDGKQVYGTPRAIAAFMIQTNTIDLSRRSPSYESRLSKYAHRGFEVYWPDLDRSRIDPTIFERSFARTMGLARLLVLEQLPRPSNREDYLNQRRHERGRPPANNSYWRRGHALRDNVKDQDPDDIAEWVYEDEISNYHTFTVPYGPKYHAKRIEKLLYTKDLLLNAEWNQNMNRTVNLHRHPCFIGPVESVIHDCCGCCPEPKIEEERKVAEEERKIYVYGDLAFTKDDPGRQTIGSFNPLTDDDWTEMAYIGNTQELCQKICDGDLDFVDAWCEKNPYSIDRRDHTGRTPLHIAAQCSTPEILECLVDHGARIVARLVDGMTALHIAAARGSVDMVTTLLEQSEENEAGEAEKKAVKQGKQTPSETEQSEEDHSDDEGSGDNISEDCSTDSDMAITEGSFVKVKDKQPADEDALDGADDTEPDVYDVNVVAWDTPVSALHLAILGGHIEVIKALVSTFGADVLLPVKIVNSYSRNPQHAIMTLVLAAQLSDPSSQDVTKEILSLGASSAQGDMNQVSAFHYLTATRKVQNLKVCVEHDAAAARAALDHLHFQDPIYRPTTHNPLTTAIRSGDADLVNALLDFEAKPEISLEDFSAAYTLTKEKITSYWSHDTTDVAEVWKTHTEQPVLLSVDSDMPDVVLRLVNAGADLNVLDPVAYRAVARFEDKNNSNHYYYNYRGSDTFLQGGSLIDAVQARISKLESIVSNQFEVPQPITLEDDQTYLKGTAADSYGHWYLSKTVEAARNIVEEWHEHRKSRLDEEKNSPDKQRRLDALRVLRDSWIGVKDRLLQRGAKAMKQLHPDVPIPERHVDDRAQETTKPDTPFEPKVSFNISTTEEAREAYLQLFEAAWEGDSARIKRLTLANWGPDRKNKPLIVSTRDRNGFTPFSIAVYRRHLEVAKLILGIANAQYIGPDEDTPRRRYTIAESESDYNSDSEEDELGISSQAVDETFTVDNIAALKETATSRVSPLNMLQGWARLSFFFNIPENEALKKLGCHVYKVSNEVERGGTSSSIFKKLLERRDQTTVDLGRYALVSRDLELLRFWLRCCQEDASKMMVENVDHFPLFGLRADFQFALKHGFIEELGEMITIAGVELPLDALVKQSGIQEEQKPKYYQGLSIRGKKMTSWARERGGNRERATKESIPPLLQSSYHGGLAAVEWFLSDTPFRLYKEYGTNNADKPRLKMLAKAHGGLDQAIGSWLKQRSHLSLHASILSHAEYPASLSVLKYLLSIFPSEIDKPASCHNLTPLALSFLKGRTDTASALIAAGADQTTRDATSKNLIHHALLSISNTSPTDTTNFRSLLSLLDKRLLAGLFTERCRESPGGLTPLAFWLASNTEAHSYWRDNSRALVPEVLAIMLYFGGAEALTMMDGSGQFPLHQAVKHSYTGLVKVMLAHDPALLSRENAMGQTPLELAENLYVRDCTKGNPDINRQGYWRLEDRQFEEFRKEEARGGAEKESEVRNTWQVCREVARREPRGRKLVSVAEAREVARRLAERNKEMKAEEGGEGKKEVVKDEVDGWLGSGPLVMGGGIIVL